MTDLAVHEVIEEGLRDLRVSPPEGAVGSLVRLSSLVEDWARRTNLTGHRSAVAIARRLVLDAAALLVCLPSFDALADLGAGAGFPGLPMAILRPGSRVFLVEARERRHHFQREAIRTLGLGNVQALHGRFEELEPVACDLVIAQAVAAPDELAGAMLRWARPGARLVVPGGAVPRSAPAGGNLLDSRVVTYDVPLGGPRRTAWLSTVL